MHGMAHVHRSDWILIKYNIFYGLVNQLKTISAIVLGLAFQDLASQFYTSGAHSSTISAPSFTIAVAMGIFVLVVTSVSEGYISACKRRELEIADTMLQRGER